MRFTLGRYDYTIEFQYSVTGKDKTPTITTCRILRGKIGSSSKKMVVFASGRAFRKSQDKFIKVIGRKRALTNALSKSSKSKNRPSKAFRSKVWNTYLTAINMPLPKFDLQNA